MSEQDLHPSDLSAAPCLADGPLAEVGRSFVEAGRRLGRSAASSILGGQAIAAVFAGMEAAFAEPEDPTPEIIDLLSRVAVLLEAGARIGAPYDGPNHPVSASVEAMTGEHYGRVFERFDADSFAREPFSLLRQRLERNNIDIAQFKGCLVLDAGCGGGRYTVAWSMLGAGRCVGVDISERGINDATQRARKSGWPCTFIRSDVLDLPLRSGAADVVFSNGVLHHTRSWRHGVRELVRTLAPGGFGWLYLIESPGGLFWDVIELMRLAMAGLERETARAGRALAGLPANRIFYMLDHVLVPVNVRLTPGQVESALSESGATHIRRLERGADFDRFEAISRGERFAAVKYGVGENRYVFSR